ncbi:unnamed protein product [Closterium sp. NIES-54]
MGKRRRAPHSSSKQSRRRIACRTVTATTAPATPTAAAPATAAATAISAASATIYGITWCNQPYSFGGSNRAGRQRGARAEGRVRAPSRGRTAGGGGCGGNGGRAGRGGCGEEGGRGVARRSRSWGGGGGGGKATRAVGSHPAPLIRRFRLERGGGQGEGAVEKNAVLAVRAEGDGSAVECAGAGAAFPPWAEYLPPPRNGTHLPLPLWNGMRQLLRELFPRRASRLDVLPVREFRNLPKLPRRAASPAYPAFLHAFPVAPASPAPPAHLAPLASLASSPALPPLPALPALPVPPAARCAARSSLARSTRDLRAFLLRTRTDARRFDYHVAALHRRSRAPNSTTTTTTVESGRFSMIVLANRDRRRYHLS